MLTTTHKTWIRWLPALALLMVLAQVSVASHWHIDDDSPLECSLCLQHSSADELLSNAPYEHIAVQANCSCGDITPVTPSVTVSYTTPIRAPPSRSLS